MVNPMVERATSSMLIGPDWAMNIEICDMLNREPGQAKDVVKGIKKRIGSKNSKVQLLALTLLETIVKNCGDIVHMHVAERDVLHDMVKIVKKKPDYQVKEKVLILIDTWQEAFGGARARYPQYYAAYQELLRAGAVFPQRSERSAPVLTPPQSHPLSSYPPNIGSSDPNLENARAETSDSEFPTLSLSEIQNAKGSMDVLTEMLSALDPGNKEGLRQEALVDLVEQCRTYKQRVVHLVNSTSDESLLCQGLALNDDLQRVLAKYESLVSGKAVPLEKPEAASAPRSLVDVDGPLVDAGESSKQADKSSAPGTSAPGPSSLAPPPSANGSASIPKTDPKMDLLSGDLLGGDDFSSPAQNSLALVPVAAAQPSSPVANDQNALALVDMFSSSPNATSSQPTPFSAGPGFQQLALQPQQPQFQAQQQFQPQQFPPQQQFQPQQQQQYQPQQQQQYQPQQQQYPFYQQQGINPGMGMTYEQPGYPQQVSGPSWGTPTVPQPSSPAHGAQNGGALPPPPWEAQSDSQPGSPYSPTVMQGGQQPLGLPAPGNNQVVGMFVQPVTSSQLTAINQSFQMPHSGMYPQQQQHMQVGGGQNMMNVHPQAMLAGHQMAPMYPQNMYGNPMQMGAGGGYGGYESGYGVQQDVQYMDQRMYGLSMRDDTGARSSVSSQSSMASYLPPMRQQGKGDDKLFGDLVNMAKLKPTKSAPSSTAGST